MIKFNYKNLDEFRKKTFFNDDGVFLTPTTKYLSCKNWENYSEYLNPLNKLKLQEFLFNKKIEKILNDSITLD